MDSVRGAMVGGKRGKDSTTSRVEKRLCQGNCLEGVLQIKRGGRASCIIYGAQNKVKIWAACSKKKMVLLKFWKVKAFPFFCGLSWPVMTLLITYLISCSFRHRDIHCVGAGPHRHPGLCLLLSGMCSLCWESFPQAQDWAVMSCLEKRTQSPLHGSTTASHTGWSIPSGFAF